MTPFEQIKHEDETGQAYWSARELAKVLGYTKWENFHAAIKRAMTACETSGYAVSDHFPEVRKMIEAGKGAQREVVDYHLSRYACYLIVQNADPEKPVVAVGQTYFATQTRAAELTAEQQRIDLRERMTEMNKSLAEAAYSAGVVTPKDFGIFQDHGYKGLYDGETAADIKARKGIKKSQHILDWMGNTELAANLFKSTQADDRIRREPGEDPNLIHHEAGKMVRKAIADFGGTMPEDLPTPSESVQQLKRREEKRLQSGPSLWEETDGEAAR